MSVKDVCEPSLDYTKEDLIFGNSVARVSCEKYSALPKTGKPNPDAEWTLLSAVVKVCGARDGSEGPSFEVVALGTGSKCIGKSAMSPLGDVLNDSHAEVVARRAFLRYLYHEAESLFGSGTSNVFKSIVDGKCAFKDDVSFSFYMSQAPCGDASIFSKENANTDNCGDRLQSVEENNSEYGLFCKRENDIIENETNHVTLMKSNNVNSKTPVNCESIYGDETSESLKTTGTKRKSEMDTNNETELAQNQKISSRITSHPIANPYKQLKTSGETAVNVPNVVENIGSTRRQSEKGPGNMKVRPANDIHRTGAKCVPSEEQDLCLPGVGYHVLGALRTKPGRGDPTLSLSCSDKLARWNAVGCQGALLSLLIEPVRFRSLIVGGGLPFSRDALTRAVVERTRSLLRNEDAPSILRASIVFPDGRPPSGSKLPCASSIAWCSVPDKPIEVAVKGRKQGVTKKVARTAAGRLQICKRELARQFVAVAASTLLPVEELRGTDPSRVTEHLGQMSYGRLKAMATDYQDKWRATKRQSFPSWPTKPPSFLDFTLNG